MRVPLMAFALGLVVVSGVSLGIRDAFFAGLVSVMAVVAICGGCLWAVRRQKKSRMTAILVGGAILAWLGIANAPLKVVFPFFESQFDSLGQRLVKGDRPPFPTWIGPFRVVDGGVRQGSGAPYLITSGSPTEINGFVRDRKGEYFNLWSITPVGDHWAYIQED